MKAVIYVIFILNITLICYSIKFVYFGFEISEWVKCSNISNAYNDIKLGLKLYDIEEEVTDGNANGSILFLMQQLKRLELANYSGTLYANFSFLASHMTNTIPNTRLAIDIVEKEFPDYKYLQLKNALSEIEKNN